MKYNVGLNIRTDSTGWCITDEWGRIVRKNGKHLYGTSVFDEASSAEERRRFRTSRRQRDRVRRRIAMLQRFLEKDVLAADDAFYIRLEESAKDTEDRQKENLYRTLPEYIFTDRTVPARDKGSGRQSLPIYRIREALISCDKQADIRYVYLALAHILKNRGHFLDCESSENMLQEMCHHMYSYLMYVNEQLSATSLSVQVSLTQTEMEELIRAIRDDRPDEELKALLINAQRAEPQGKTNAGQQKKIEISRDRAEKWLNLLIDLIGGKSIDLSELLMTKRRKGLLSFEELLSNKIYDKLEYSTTEALQHLWEIYDWRKRLRKEREEEKTSVSNEMNRRYEQHKADLKELKKWVKTFAGAEAYSRMFHSDLEKDNYNAYAGSRTGETNTADRWNSCSQEKFYQALRSLFMKTEEGKEEAQRMLKRMFNEHGGIIPNGFLPLQRISENSEISNQQQVAELKAILEKQGKYYASIRENADKILALATFRIPYYVGPLRQDENSPFTPWIKYKGEKEPILPWNMEEKIDLAATAEEWVGQVTNNCTFLLGEKVLPKHSLIYEEYMILNELNTMYVEYEDPSAMPTQQAEQTRMFEKEPNKEEKAGESAKKCIAAIPSRLRLRMIRELFVKQKKVSVPYITKWLSVQEYKGMRDIRLVYKNGEPVQRFNTRLTAWADMERILKRPVNPGNESALEKIIKWSTLYTDRSIYVKRLRAEITGFTEDEMRQFEGLRYNGWGRFSEKLLTDDRLCMLNGKNISVLELMRRRHVDFMNIYHKNMYQLKDRIALENREEDEDIFIEDIQAMPCSAATKRGLWNAIRVLREITAYMGARPEHIFIRNMRESNKEKAKDTQKNVSRYDQLRTWYDNYEKETGEKIDPEIKALLQAHHNSRITDTEFLYFTQLGRCMYTGEKIDLNVPASYKEDYVIPLYITTDKSIQNRVLVRKNKRVQGLPLAKSTIRYMSVYWDRLCRAGLISGQKNTNLRVYEYNNDTYGYYMSRQLTENSLLIARFTRILNKYFKESVIYAINARLTDLLRAPDEQREALYSVRSLNDLQYAYDAFLTAHIGSFVSKYLTSFMKNGSQMQIWISKEERKGDHDKNGVFKSVYNQTMPGEKKYKKTDVNTEDKKKNMIYREDVTGSVWADSNERKDYLRKVYGWHEGFVSRRVKEYTGKFYYETTFRPVAGKESSLVSKKGSHKQAYVGSMAIISYKDENKREWKEVINVPAYVAAGDTLLDYIQRDLGFVPSNGYFDVTVLRRKVLLNQEAVIDGHSYYLRTAGEWINARQLYVKSEYVKSIYKALTMSLPEQGLWLEAEEEEEITRTAAYLATKLRKDYNIYGKLSAGISDLVDIEATRAEEGKRYDITEKIRTLPLKDRVLLIRVMLNCMNTHNERVMKFLKEMEKPLITGENRLYNKRLRAESIQLVHRSVTGLRKRKEII